MDEFAAFNNEVGARIARLVRLHHDSPEVVHRHWRIYFGEDSRGSPITLAQAHAALYSSPRNESWRFRLNVKDCVS